MPPWKSTAGWGGGSQGSGVRGLSGRLSRWVAGSLGRVRSGSDRRSGEVG